MTFEPGQYELDLQSSARKIVQRMDRRAQRIPPQTATRIALQQLDVVQSNGHRSINLKADHVAVADDPTEQQANLLIPGGFLYFIVGDGLNAITASSTTRVAFTHVPGPFALSVLQWTLLAQPSGSVTIDLKHGSYANWPTTTASIISGTAPNIASSTKNKSPDYIDPATGLVSASWTALGWTNLAAGDVLDLYITAAATVSLVSLTLKMQAVSQ